MDWDNEGRINPIGSLITLRWSTYREITEPREEGKGIWGEGDKGERFEEEANARRRVGKEPRKGIGALKY